MRYVLLKKSKIFSALALSVVVSSCSLKSNGQQQTVTIALPGAQISQFQWFEKMTDWISVAWAMGSTTPLNLNTTPTALTDFDCFAVNVSGPDIPLDPMVSCSDPSDAPAIFGGFVPNGNASIDLLVPAGPNRSIKILGVKTTLPGCPNLHDLAQSGVLQVKDNVSQFYTIGAANTDIFADTSINIKASFNAASSVTAFNNCQRDGGNNANIWNVFAGTGPGYINATKTVNGTSYVGGHFDYIGPNTHKGAMLAQSNGAIASTSNNPAHIDGTVNCSVRDGDGGFYVGGDLTGVDSYSFNYKPGLIHIKADGSFDQSFFVQVDSGSISTCAFDTNTQTVFVAGTFSHLYSQGGDLSASILGAIPIGSKQPHNLGGLFNPTSSPVILAMDVNPSLKTLYVGGNFADNGSPAKSYAIAIDTGNYSESGWNPSPGMAVSAVYADSKNSVVYLGGAFTNHLMRVNAAWGVDSWPSAAISAQVKSITKDSTYVYVAASNGSFPQIYRVNISTGAVSSSLLAGGSTESFNSIGISIDGSQLYVGGSFSINDSSGQKHQSLLSISNPATVSDSSAGLGVNLSFLAGTTTFSAVNTVAPNYVGKMFVGGDFQSVGGFLRNNIAAIDLTTGQATSWTSPYAGLGEIQAIKSDGSSIYAAYSSSGQIPGVIKVGTDGSQGGSWVTGSASDSISALFLDSNYLYVGGKFNSLTGGSGYTNVARIIVGSGGPTTDAAWRPAFGATSDFVSHIFADGNNVYPAGSISSLSALHAVDGTQGSTGPAVAGFSPPPIGGPVDSMVHIPANTYSFAPSGAIMIGSGGSLKLFDPSSGTPIAWVSPSLSTAGMNHTTKLVREGNLLYIAGQAQTLGQALLAYDLSTQSLTPLQLGIQNNTTAMSVETVGNGNILVGGNFTQVNTVSGTGGKQAWGIGLFDATTGMFY